LRTRSDLIRLLGAFLGSALLVALQGFAQYFFFAGLLQGSLEGDRVRAVYGSANSIGLFFDYILPLGMSLLIAQIGRAWHTRGTWWFCLLTLVLLVPMAGVLVLSQSLGSALALLVALLFILAMSIRERKALLLSALVFLVIVMGATLLLHKPLLDFLSHWHDNTRGISTTSKRFYLWESAWNMIRSHSWFGVGMNNWLCYYSHNRICPLSGTIKHPFLMVTVPGTLHHGTGLADEPTLSHPHNIFLHVWVSIGIFGLLAFVTLLGLFAWLFARVFRTVRYSSRAEVKALEWIVLGVGAAMLAALCQGLVDSSFLEQDLAFCFWTLIALLFILRMCAGTPWRGKLAR